MTKSESIIGPMLERLFLASRELQANGVNSPSFVLIAYNTEHRHKLEGIILGYLVDKYGFGHSDLHPGDKQSTFRFPEYGYSISIIEWSECSK